MKEPRTNLTWLLQRHAVCLGQVTKEFTKSDEVIYFACVEGHGRKNRLSSVLMTGYIDRDKMLPSDPEFDSSIYSMLLESPWFPMGVGKTPQEALSNFIERVNSPVLKDVSHLLPFLTDKVKKRWELRSLRDKLSGEYKFHKDLMFVVPEDEKGLKG